MNAPYVQSRFLKKGLLEIEFFHPKHNALPSAILSELAQTILQAGQNPEVQVIILKSGGDRTFCAGASFDELVAIDDFATGKQFFMGFAQVINACRKCSKLIIGRVQGKAIGGGVGLASAVDYCLATQYASIKLSELNVGIGPFVVGPAVSRKMGLSAMSQLAINANELQTAEWAQTKGLYTEVFENTTELDEGVQKLADYLLSTNPEAQAQLKQIFWEGCEDWDELLEKRAEMSGRLVLSDFTKQALVKYVTQL
ncbi:MAG TPA: enoyl-CoA hydratase [Microscillaceae bacterium]|nr:enoyl-CoA hydratase [Microscillaceae bacterium]